MRTLACGTCQLCKQCACAGNDYLPPTGWRYFDIASELRYLLDTNCNCQAASISERSEATTCASRVSAPVGHRKRPPPMQVTVATTTCASRVSAPVGHKDHQCKLQWPRASTRTIRTTTCARKQMHSMAEEKDHQCKLQPVRTSTADIGVYAAASKCACH